MSASAGRGVAPLLVSDIAALRADFPALRQSVHGHPLVYLDSAASSQVPQAVLDAMTEQQAVNHANIHRGVHELSERATRAYEGARDKARRYLNAAEREEIIFTRGTTESINLVAASLGGSILGPGDEVLLTWMEHHSNIVPWQLICARTGARLVPVPITPAGEVDPEVFARHVGPRTKIAAIAHVSNALGTVNPVKEMTAAAKSVGAAVVIDGAQAAAHCRIDVRDIGCDFYALSGHKMYAPTGIGVLYGRREMLESMPPYQGGGEMILSVSFDETRYNTVPYMFEAGTPNITGAVSLGAAIDYLEAIDRAALEAHEADLLSYATERLAEIPGSRVIGTARHKAGVLSFVLRGIHAHDLGTIVNQAGVAIRTGHHCAMPVMQFFDVPATARASFGLYSNRDDVDQLMLGLRRAMEIFA
jgi:cysteine desulfurase / selenocysteine lyase